MERIGVVPLLWCRGAGCRGFMPSSTALYCNWRNLEEEEGEEVGPQSLSSSRHLGGHMPLPATAMLVIVVVEASRRWLLPPLSSHSRLLPIEVPVGSIHGYRQPPRLATSTSCRVYLSVGCAASIQINWYLNDNRRASDHSPSSRWQLLLLPEFISSNVLNLKQMFLFNLK